MLKDATGEEAHWAEDLPQALSRLREQVYSAVVLDQFLLEFRVNITRVHKPSFDGKKRVRERPYSNSCHLQPCI